MKRQESLEVALTRLKEAVAALRPLSLNDFDEGKELLLQCVKCELAAHKLLVSNMVQESSCG